MQTVATSSPTQLHSTQLEFPSAVIKSNDNADSKETAGTEATTLLKSKTEGNCLNEEARTTITITNNMPHATCKSHRDTMTLRRDSCDYCHI